MSNDEILELKSQNAFPIRQERLRVELKETSLDDGPVRLDAFQVEPRVAVANSITLLTQGLAGLGIEPTVPADETGMTKILKRLRQPTAGRALFGRRQLGHGQRTLRKMLQGLPTTGRMSPEDARESLLEFAEEQAVRLKAHPPHVFLQRLGRAQFKQVFRHTTGDRKKVNPLPRRQSLTCCAQKFDALVKRQLADLEIKGIAPDKPSAVEDVLGNPRRDRTAENDNQPIVLAEESIPRDFQIPGEVRIVRPHPGDFIQQKHRSPVLWNRLVQGLKRHRPRRRANTSSEKKRNRLAKMRPLPLVRKSLARGQSLKNNQPVGRPFGELLNQRALADATTTAT